MKAAAAACSSSGVAHFTRMIFSSSGLRPHSTEAEAMMRCEDADIAALSEKNAWR